MVLLEIDDKKLKNERKRVWSKFNYIVSFEELAPFRTYSLILVLTS